MKQLTIVAVAGIVALVIWRIAGHISSDALALGIGVAFGALAGVPASLVVLASYHQHRMAPPPSYRVLPQPQQQEYIDAERRLTER